MQIKKLNKKAAVEIQFNWLYVAIAGFFILLVFFTVANGIRKSAEKQQEYELLNYFDALLVGVQDLENSESNISLSNMQLKIDSAKTGNDQCNYYTIGKNAIKKENKFIPIFSPETINSQLFTNTLAWYSPFKVTHFIYMTSSNHLYVYDDENIKKNLPSNIKAKSLSNFQNQNYDSIRFIFLNTDPLNYNLPNAIRNFKDSKITAVKINFDLNKITYYQKKGFSFEEKGSSNFYDKETLLAAIYSDNKEAYECNLKKAITRLNKITKLLIKRAEKLSSSDLLQSCDKNQYLIAKSLLEQIEQITNDGEISENNFVSTKNQLKELNTNLMKKSCPSIY
ncbi:MAG: hypothetical protein QXE31_05670 [Candidatus Woesearchaeota archaeon]